MPGPDPDPLPSTPTQWEKEAKKPKVLNSSVHELLKVDSASSIGLDQYYSLRVLWDIRSRDLPYATIFDLSRGDEPYEEASEFLKTKSPSWQSYLAAMSLDSEASSANKTQDIGAFSNVRYYQLHVDPRSIAYKNTLEENMAVVPSKFSPRRLRGTMSTQSKMQSTPLSKGENLMKKGSPDSIFGDTSLMSVDSSAPPSPQTPATIETTAPAEDEQIVNIALVLWLQTLTMFHPFIQAEDLKWSVKRVKFDFGNWEARTDGCLRRRKEIKAIIEVKPFVRRNFARSIQKQESAQMAAWVRNFPDHGGWSVVKNGRNFERRLLISQDSIEIYLTVAEFEPAYKEYICDEQPGKVSERSFMTMRQYGPWDTGDRKHMAHLGKLLLAFTLKWRQSSSYPYRPKRTPPPTPTKPTKFQTKKTETTGTTGTIEKPETPRQPVSESVQPAAPLKTRRWMKSDSNDSDDRAAREA